MGWDLKVSAKDAKKMEKSAEVPAAVQETMDQVCFLNCTFTIQLFKIMGIIFVISYLLRHPGAQGGGADMQGSR